jgi:hypothetical protein
LLGFVDPIFHVDWQVQIVAVTQIGELAPITLNASNLLA